MLHRGMSFRVGCEVRTMSNETSPAEMITYPKATPQTPPALVKKIGKTTYRVWVHFSTTSTEMMEDKIERLLREEVRQATGNIFFM